MSSFELLELFGASVVEDSERELRTIRIDFAPEDGALADALRGGDRPEWKRMLAQIANEQAVVRAAFVPGADSEFYESQLFLPAPQLRQMQDEAHREEDEERSARAEDVNDSSDLYSLWQEVS